MIDTLASVLKAIGAASIPAASSRFFGDFRSSRSEIFIGRSELHICDDDEAHTLGLNLCGPLTGGAARTANAASVKGLR
jgi:hypothetical protein